MENPVFAKTPHGLALLSKQFTSPTAPLGVLKAII